MIDKQKTSAAIDIVNKKIRYLDTLYKKGNEVLLKLKRWLRVQWERVHTDSPPELKTLSDFPVDV